MLTLDAQNPREFSLLSTSPERLIDRMNSYTLSHFLITRVLISVSQKVNNLESTVVVQELELALNLALYGLL